MNLKKIIITFSLLLIAAVSFAQFAPPSGYGKQENRFAPLLFFRPPVVNDTSMNLISGANVDSLGAIVTLSTDSLMYRWNGVKWQNIIVTPDGFVTDGKLNDTLTQYYTKAQLSAASSADIHYTNITGAPWINSSEKGAANGVAELDAGGKVPLSQMNDALLGAVRYQGTYNAATNVPALGVPSSANKGWYYIVSTAGSGPGFPVDTGDYVISNGIIWDKIDNNNKVVSVAGKIGVVTLDKNDVGLNNVDNTSDLSKPISTATQAALDGKADETISLTAGTGLTGGGNLTANRSFAVNFGTAAGTVAQGNDSRINNGQTAFGWGNHASAGYLTTTTGDARYPQLSGSYANPSWLTSLAWSKITAAPTSFPTSSDLQTVLGNGNTSTIGAAFTAANIGVRWFDGGTPKWWLRQETFPAADMSAYAYDDAGNAGLVYRINRASRVVDYSFSPTRAGNTMWDANNHPSGTTGSITYTGAEVPASFSFNSAGHYTASGKRTLTAGDIGAAPVSGSGNYIQANPATPQGVYSNVSLYQKIQKDGSNSLSASLILQNAANTKGVNLQLNGDANPGLATWIHDGAAWVKRMEILSNGTTQFYSNVTMSNAGAVLNIANYAQSGKGFYSNAGTNAGGSLHFKLSQSDGTQRWAIGLQTVESGSNTGSNFNIWRYDDAGAFINQAFALNRANGSFSFPNIMSGGATGVTITPALTVPVVQSPSGENLTILANGAPTDAQLNVTVDGLGIGGMPGGIHTARLFVGGNVVSDDAYVLDGPTGEIGEFFLSSGEVGVRTTTAHPLTFYSNNQQRMTIRADGVIHTTSGISSHARIVSTASAYSINPNDYVVIMEGMATGSGAGVLITLPDPNTNGGRLLEFHEYSASNWETNYDIYQPNNPPLTTIGGVMVIRAVAGKWRLVSKH